jgi:hypothetical protein
MHEAQASQSKKRRNGKKEERLRMFVLKNL